MMKKFTPLRFKIILSVTLVSATLLVFPQTQKNAPSSCNNSFNVPNSLWKNYVNKTSVLLKEMDPQGFLNGVIITSHGSIADKDDFNSYVSKDWQKDYEKLVYKIGIGVVTTQENASAYFSSLQANYKIYFKEFQAQKNGLVQTHNQQRSPNPVNPSPQNCGSPCTNPGFESGNTFWDYWGGNPDLGADPINLTPGFNPPTGGPCVIGIPPFGISTPDHPNPHTITNLGSFDAIVGGSILPVVPPGGGSKALRLGDTSAWESCHWGAARASISFTVSASNANFTYKYAVVLHDPGNGHTTPERPYFRIKIRDAAGNVLSCGNYEVRADATLPEFVHFIETSPGSSIWYRPWTTVFVPLQSYIGQCITVEFTTSDCVPGGHLGYAYVDCVCDPLAIIASSPNVCGGTSVTLSAPAGGAHYQWTNTSGGTAGIVGTDTMQTVVVSQAGTYQVVITSVAGPTCTTTLNITIGSNPSLPVAHFTNDTVCAGAPMHFHDTSTPVGSITGWKWDFDGDGVADDTTQNPTHTFPALGTYPVTLIIAWGACNAVDTQNVYVNTGNPPVLTPAGPFCAGNAPVNLAASVSGGTWAGPGITNVTLGTFTPSVSIIGNDTITYTAVGACPSSASMVIVVTPGPVADAGPDLVLCSGGSGTIGVASVTGLTYAWLPTTGITGSTTVSNPSVTLTNPLPTASTTTTYTLTVTASGCSSTDLVDVVVNAVTIVNAGSTQRVCPGASITLAGSVGGSATSGTWSGGTGTYAPDNTTLTAVYTPSTAEYAADSVILTLTTNDPAGPCTFSSSNVTFRFYQIPLVDFTADSITGCKIHCTNFNSLTMIVAPDNITGLIWDFGDGTAASTVPNPTHCFSQTGYYDIQLIATSNHGCLASLIKTHFIHIFLDPIAEFNPTPYPATIIDPTITLNNQSSSDVNYWYWDFGDGTHLSPNTASPVHVYPNDTAGHFTATLIVRNSDGCYDTIAHDIYLGTGFSFFIPNAFTPNGDKINEYFFGAGVGIIKYDMWIFDRWGNNIFHGLNLNDKWDGKANNGAEIAQMDVYVWKVELTDVYNKKHNYIGTVTLVK